MTTTHSPDELYTRAQQGIKLTPVERRRVISLLEEKGEITSNHELARIFQVTEKRINSDRARILQKYASAITPERAMMMVAAFNRSHDQLLVQARLGLQKCQPGVPSHQNYLKLISDLEERKISKLQSIGVIPKELGRLAVTEEKWIAIFSDEGLASVHPDTGVEIEQLEAGADPLAVDGEVTSD